MGVMVSSCGIASSCLFVFVVIIVEGEENRGVVMLAPGGVGRWGVVDVWREVAWGSAPG